jgi:hypothetical protein
MGYSKSLNDIRFARLHHPMTLFNVPRPLFQGDGESISGSIAPSFISNLANVVTQKRPSEGLTTHWHLA